MSIFRLNRPIRFIQAAIFLTGIFLLTACGSMPGAATAEPTPSDAGDALVEEVSASGEVIPDRWASLSFPNGGTKLEFLVSEGDVVTKDQELIASDDTAQRAALHSAQALLEKAELVLEQLNNSPTAAALAAAESALASAQANYERLDNAGARDIDMAAAQAQVDSAQAALDELNAGPSEKQIAAAEQDVKAAQEGIRQAEAALADATLKAPFDGRVIEIIPNEFESAAPLQTVLILADLSGLHVETTDMSEVDAARIQPGDAARVVFDALPSQTIGGKVERIALRSSGGSAVYYRVIISLDEIPTGLRWGMSSFVVIP